MVDYDLHIHTTASDGILSPQEVIEIAADKGLKGLAITDHDTVDAIEAGVMLGKKHGIDFIPGIELSTEYEGSEIHMLGYYIDYNNIELIGMLNGLKEERFQRFNKMVEKAKALGFDVSFDEIKNTMGDNVNRNSLGRPHLARLLVEKGYFGNMQEVFSKLLGSGMPCYVERQKFTAKEGIKAIKGFGGIPVIAHPGLIKNIEKHMEKMIQDLKSCGLGGIEVYHTDQTDETSLYLSKLAYKYDLVMTGGSDYHAPRPHKESSIGSKGVPSVNVEKLKNAVLG